MTHKLSSLPDFATDVVTRTPAGRIIADALTVPATPLQRAGNIYLAGSVGMDGWTDKDGNFHPKIYERTFGGVVGHLFGTAVGRRLNARWGLINPWEEP